MPPWNGRARSRGGGVWSSRIRPENAALIPQSITALLAASCLDGGRRVARSPLGGGLGWRDCSLLVRLPPPQSYHSSPQSHSACLCSSACRTWREKLDGELFSSSSDVENAGSTAGASVPNRKWREGGCTCLRFRKVQLFMDEKELSAGKVRITRMTGEKL